ncbi:MAG TPA: N-acetylmuramoyl-L-alanine amidase, partial [Tepidisphaeraceae bacterium]|nr:N-acetylmuramoyl-L-alanine amidase [Tepidisphaeraceae bacterium]
KQLVNFIPKDDDDNPLDSLDVSIDVYEMKVAKTSERADSPMLTIKGKVLKTEGYNFVVDEISQDEKKLPQVKKPKSKSGAELFMTAKLEVVGVDDKARGKSGLEFVLPPMEYDETLELQMGSSIPGSVNSQAKVTFGTYEEMLSAAGISPTDRKDGIPHGGAHSGNLHHFVVHCMCNILAAPDPNDAYDLDGCLKIFKDNGVSAHYIIERDGNVVEAVDIHNVAHHAFSKGNTSAHGLYSANERSIGIELLGIPDKFRDQKVKQFEEAKKDFEDKKAKLEKGKKDLEEALAKREGEKAAGKKKVNVNGVDTDVDVAIAKIKAVITAQDEKIAALKPADFVEQWETFIKDKDTDGVPLVFKYTAAQYEALGKMLEVYGKRYGYEIVCSHHYIIPAAKTDPGIYFDWSKLTPHLLPGDFSGDESGGGGLLVVKI